MIKFTLIIWVCSFLNGTECMAPINFPVMYDSWKECSVAAHTESIKIIESTEPDFLNKYEIGMKYTCRSVRTY